MANYDFRAKDIIWSNTPYSNAALRELPYVEMRGYQQTHSAVMENIKAWIARVEQGGGGNPYKDLYTGDPKMNMRLPYFSEYHHNINQGWEINQGVLGDTMKTAVDMATNVASIFKPAAGILYPKNYAGAQESSWSFTFPLVNTYGGADPVTEIPVNVGKNRAFLEDLIKGSLHDQQNSIAVNPPYIWEAFIPGVRWSPACVINNLTVNNKGTMNSGQPYGMDRFYLFPDAWEVTIGVRELINESRTIYADAIRGTSSFAKDTRTLG
jgi:hypothetical protein